MLEGRFAGIHQTGYVARRRFGPSLGCPPPPIGLHQYVGNPQQDNGLDERDDCREHRTLTPRGVLFWRSAQSRADRPTTNKAMDPWPPRVAYVGNRGDVMGTGS